MESQCGKLTHGVLFTGGDDEILWLVVLQDEPHALHIILGVAPIATARQIAKIEFLLLPLLDAGCGERNLSGHKGLATALTLMIEQNAVAGKHVVGIAVFFHNPVTVLLGHGIRTVGVERRVLVLRHFLHLAIELGGRSLIDAATVGQSQLAHSLQDAQHTHGIHIGRVFGRVEAHLHMALSREVVDFGWTDHTDDTQHTHRVAEVGIVQVEVGLAFQMSNARTEID